MKLSGTDCKFYVTKINEPKVHEMLLHNFNFHVCTSIVFMCHFHDHYMYVKFSVRRFWGGLIVKRAKHCAWYPNFDRITQTGGPVWLFCSAEGISYPQFDYQNRLLVRVPIAPREMLGTKLYFFLLMGTRTSKQLQGLDVKIGLHNSSASNANIDAQSTRVRARYEWCLTKSAHLSLSRCYAISSYTRASYIGSPLWISSVIFCINLSTKIWYFL